MRVRGKAVALATSANWAFNTALGAFVPPAFETIRYKVYIIFGIFNLVMFFHVLFLFPETAGKTLEDTEKMFEDPNGIRYLGTPAWKVSQQIFLDSVEYLLMCFCLQTKVEYQSMARMEKGDVPPGKFGSIDDGHESDEKSPDEKV